jgi:hypothetical protein
MSDTKKPLTQRPAADEEDNQMSMEDPGPDPGYAEEAVAVQVAAVLGLGTEATIDNDGCDVNEDDDNDITVQDAMDADVDVDVDVERNVPGDDSADEDDSDDEVEAVASVVDEDDDDDDNDEAVVDAVDAGDDHDIPAEQPTVVVAMEDVEEGGDDDIPEVEAVAIVEEEPPLLPQAASSSAMPKSSVSDPTTKSPKRNNATKANSMSSNPANKKRKKTNQTTSKGGELAVLLPKIDAKRIEAANTAREMLYEAVPRLPFPVSESSSDQYYVRNFGRLQMGNDEISSKFSTATALYPVGFSCDRYEFSPSHGRILKLRCSIIDGNIIGETGPIFRVMWGQGVDDDVDTVEYPYDPFTNSAPITSQKSGNDEAFVVPTVPAMHHSMDQQVVPAVGMRVKSRFDKNQFFHGTISKVVERDEGHHSANSKKKKKKEIHITIIYDDGSNEETTFPDSDITLVMPGTILIVSQSFLLRF